MPDATLDTISLTSRTYRQMKRDIISGKLAPGRKLKIEELRKAYDTGTSPIREALSLLTSDHLVERLEQRGFRVSAVSAGEFEELLNTRCWLEERALRESIAHGTAQWKKKWCSQITDCPVYPGHSQMIILCPTNNGKLPIRTFI